MVVNHEYFHEELIQDHSLQLTELETKSKYKEQSIMEIKEDLRQVNLKLDKLIKKVKHQIPNSKEGLKTWRQN